MRSRGNARMRTEGPAAVSPQRGPASCTHGLPKRAAPIFLVNYKVYDDLMEKRHEGGI